MADKEEVSRRNTLKAIGFGAIGLMAVTGSVPAAAQIQLPPGTLTLKLSDPRAVKSLNFTNRRLPATTPITKMLTPAGAEGLSPAARTLTKADLVAMQSGRVTPAAARLTVRDIQTIQGAFAKPGGLAAADVSLCCCCTPCCCAAAVEPELALAA